jgi:hypothetical protein
VPGIGGFFTGCGGAAGGFAVCGGGAGCFGAGFFGSLAIACTAFQ